MDLNYIKLLHSINSMESSELLPDELWFLVFCKFKNPIDIFNTSLTCRQFYNVTNDQFTTKSIKNQLNRYEDYYFDYPGSLWLLPMLCQKTFINFKYQQIRLACLFGTPAIMIEEASKNVEKLHEMANFVESLPNFNSLEKTFPYYPDGRLRIRYYFNIPKKWKSDFSKIKLQKKGNHLKISNNYKNRIRKRYPNINLELF